MKNAKILTILILAMALMLCLVGLSRAAPIGTAFTYQGRLTEDGNPADGLYDFQFKLFDDPNVILGNQVGTTIDMDDVEVNDGYFTVVLDFGPYAFDGNARWLEITVVQNEGAAPNDFITLTPRQELTPTPYAIRAQIADKVVDALTGQGTTNYLAKFTGTKSLGDSAVYEDADKVGIGTDQPGYRLEVKSSGYMDGMAVTSSDGQRLFRVRQNSDTSCGIHVFGDNDNVGAAVSGKGSSYFNGGNVGIGTTSPFYKLEVANHMPGDSAESAVTADDAGGAIAAYSSTFSTIPHLADRVSLFSNLLTATGLDLRADGITSDMRFYTGGITPSDERMRITPGGNVGIGTTNPGAKLEVKQDSWQDIVKVGTPDTSNRLILSSGPDYASVSGGQTNQNSIMISHSTGNVGIGPSGTLPQAKLQVNGDLKAKGDVTVDGAYVGTFPRPAYDTGWVPLLQNQVLTCIHNLEGNVDNYVVDLQMKDTNYSDYGIHNKHIGGDCHVQDSTYYSGAHWYDLDTSSIKVRRMPNDLFSSQVRIRIWVYK
jgi:hypothetical protein